MARARLSAYDKDEHNIRLEENRSQKF